MANHQHALIRYVTLDDCLSRLKLTREELIDRCSEALDRHSGSGRRISERTFYNDIKHMKSGQILGREADIVTTRGVYYYGEPGFTLFPNKQSDYSDQFEVFYESERRIHEVLSILIKLDIPEMEFEEIREKLLGQSGLLQILEPGPSSSMIRFSKPIPRMSSNSEEVTPPSIEEGLIPDSEQPVFQRSLGLAEDPRRPIILSGVEYASFSDLANELISVFMNKKYKLNIIQMIRRNSFLKSINLPAE